MSSPTVTVRLRVQHGALVSKLVDLVADATPYSTVLFLREMGWTSTGIDRRMGSTTEDMNRLCSLASAVLMQTNPCSIINRLPSSHFAPPASKFVLLPLPGWSTPWLDCGSLTCMPPRSSPRLSHWAAPIRARRAQSPDARSDQSRGLPSRWGALMRPCCVPSRLLSVCFCPDY